LRRRWIASGVLFAFVGDLPQISALDDYSPSTTSRVLGRDGSVVGEVATERRRLVTYDQIPPVLRNAIISAVCGEPTTCSILVCVTRTCASDWAKCAANSISAAANCRRSRSVCSVQKPPRRTS
jgi:hypothetical protein